MAEPEIDRQELFNEIQEGQVYPHNDKWYSHLLDQYKLYVEMADRISARRATANSYFLSVNSAILAFVGYLTSKGSDDFLWLLAVAGVTLAYFWRALIQSYKNLNTAKWLVVHRIEKRLPISPYDAEWDAMGRGKNPKLYRPLTHIEVAVPIVFMVLHAFVFLRTFPYWPTICVAA
ncbi:hypothetical protein LK996_07090 [Lysobacter sp. A6]|uniref:Small integral membrane protein n=1 Tax=Noviluteimonas lactosilytica TaxID=2888523 RepID=A0ABS8JGV7_9GAMM|nr:hypothetical protein [Lysobacter lactosilyticus]MCC8362840.1 hypothetical protein [Lysobacter lactosilyticus]